MFDFDLAWNWAKPKLVRQKRPENCVQTVLSMIFGVGVEQIERVACTTGSMSLERAMELFQRLGVEARPLEAELAAAFWPLFYDRHGRAKLRGIGMRLPRDGEGEIGHAMLVYGKRVYDPATGKSERLTTDLLSSLDWLLLLSAQSVEGDPQELRRRFQRLLVS